MFEDGTIINELLIERLNYLIYVVLLLIGLHAMIAKKNLIKKLIGMSIFQTAIILFYVSIGVKEGSTIPVYLPEHDLHGSHSVPSDTNETSHFEHGPFILDSSLVRGYANPLPHVLMLTAIVVGVATLGLALALCLRIYQGYGTIEEDEVLAKIERQEMLSKPSIVVKSVDSSKTTNSKAEKPPSKPKVSSSSPSTKRPQAIPKTKAKAASTSAKAKTSRAKSVSPKAKPAASKSTTTGSKKSPAKSKTAASKPTTKAKPKPKVKSKAKPAVRTKSSSPAKKATASKPKPRTPKK